MKKLIISIIIFSVISFSYAQEAKKPVIIYLGTALTQDDIDWSIAGDLNGENPNILSEVIWKDLKGIALNAGLEVPILKNVYIKGNFSRSFINGGTATDTDYSEDDRTNRVFRADLDSKDGYLTHYQLKAGYHFFIVGLRLSPNLGYSNYIQYLHLTDTDLPKLNSTYKTLWNGLSAGLEITKKINKFNFHTTLDYHQVNYEAEANWNLIDEFKHPVSFRHIAKGFGITADFALLYEVKKNISPFVNFGLNYWSTGSGIDELYYKDGRTARTRLNDVSRNGYHIGLGLKITIPR